MTATTTETKTDLEQFNTATEATDEEIKELDDMELEAVAGGKDPGDPATCAMFHRHCRFPD